MRFVDLTCSLEDVLENHKISVHTVTLFISRLCISTRQEPSSLKFVVDDPEKELGAVGSIGNVLSFLGEKKLVTFYNFKLFECIIDKWCTESTLAEEFKLYKKYLREYAKIDISKSFLYCKTPQDTVAEGKQLILVTDKTWNHEKTFQDVLSLEAEVADIMGIQEFALVLRRIECINECLKLHHYFPQVMVVTIKSGEAKKLINRGILTVSCGEDHYNLNELRKFYNYRDTRYRVHCFNNNYCFNYMQL